LHEQLIQIDLNDPQHDIIWNELAMLDEDQERYDDLHAIFSEQYSELILMPLHESINRMVQSTVKTLSRDYGLEFAMAVEEARKKAIENLHIAREKHQDARKLL
jgi:hypothetical protein